MKQISPQELDVINIQLSEAVNCISDLVQYLCTECTVDKKHEDWKGLAVYTAEHRIPVIVSRLNVISRDLMHTVQETEKMVDEALQK